MLRLREGGTEYHSRPIPCEIAGSTPVPATNDDVSKRPKEADCNSVNAGSNLAIVFKNIIGETKSESKNVQTNFIETAADQPKLVWLEWVKIWILSGTFYVRDDPCGRYPDIRSRDFSWAYSVSGQHDGLQNRKREFESYCACIGV